MTSEYTPNHPPSNESDEIRDAIARTLFVDDWARKQEERGKSLRGDLMAEAPATPRVATRAADRIRLDIERENGQSLDAIYWRILYFAHTLERGKIKVVDRHEFGVAITLEMLGHGAGLGDYSGYMQAYKYMRLHDIEYHDGDLEIGRIFRGH